MRHLLSTICAYLLMVNVTYAQGAADEPADPFRSHNAAADLLRQGKPESALELLREIEKSPSAEMMATAVAATKAEALSQLGRHMDAIRIAQEALSKKDGAAIWLLRKQLAHDYAAVGNFKAAYEQSARTTKDLIRTISVVQGEYSICLMRQQQPTDSGAIAEIARRIESQRKSIGEP